MGPYQVLLFRSRVELGAMAMKGYSAFPNAPALLEPHHQIVLCHIQDTRWGSYPSVEKHIEKYPKSGLLLFVGGGPSSSIALFFPTNSNHLFINGAKYRLWWKVTHNFSWRACRRFLSVIMVQSLRSRE